MAFLAPVLLILLGNFIAFVLIIRSLGKSGTNVNAGRKTSGITQARRGIAILMVLGLTWLFGVLAIRDAKLYFQYLFCIVNSLQGLLVFIFYCVLQKDTRKKWKSLCSRKRNANISSGHDYRQNHEVFLSNRENSTPTQTVSSTNHAESMEMQ